MRLELVSKSLKQKLCLSIQFNILYLLCHLVTLILDLCASAPRLRACVRVHFPATYFLYFVARFAQTPSLFFVEKKTSKRKSVRLRESIDMFTSIYRLISRNNWLKMEKSEFAVVKWSSKNEGFEDKKRRGRLIVLNKAAKIVLKKVRYKRDNSTRYIALTIVNKPFVERFHEKRRLEAPEMATKPLLSLQKNDQLVSNL